MLSAQNSLPSLPIPTIDDTCERWLASVKPLVDADEYQECLNLTNEFKNGIGPKLQNPVCRLPGAATYNWMLGRAKCVFCLTNVGRFTSFVLGCICLD